MTNHPEKSAWDRAREEYACDHKGRVLLTVHVAKNGARFFRTQCRFCGETIENVYLSTLTRFQQAGAIPFDEEIKRKRLATIQKRADEIRVRDETQRKAEFDRWYAEYLRSEQWASIRERVLARAMGICEGCMKRAAVQVHHKTYDRVGREMLFDLVAVCLVCHRAIHEEHDS